MIALLDALNELADALGVGVREITFAIVRDDGHTLTPAQFTWTVEGDQQHRVFEGKHSDLAVRWEFVRERGGYWVRLAVRSDEPLHVKEIRSLALRYAPPGAALDRWWIANSGSDVHTVGLHRVAEIDDRNRSDRLLRGAFADDERPGLFLGTRIPQTHEHWYTVYPEADMLHWVCATRFGATFANHIHLRSEATWVCATMCAADALLAYAEHVPVMEHQPAPPVGWNSWDRYYFTVSLADLVENMEAIRADPVLAQHIQYIVIDDGWEHRHGEWEPNYKFEGGLARAAAEITARGFIPGIWTAPLLVNDATHAALRTPELLIKNRWGDPEPSRDHGNFILDPTHPAGEQFVRQLYSGLYEAGFRLFKIDYLEDGARNHRFHRQDMGPYDALRHLFATIRACVTADSHILGCSLPAECGPGVADSGRIAIDIHNQWSHVEWVADYLQWHWWQHGRIWINDPDFLVVRGGATSTETTTTVLNPRAHDPEPPRWRRGTDFDEVEARTWTNMVKMSGGSVFLSDRISALNQRGHDLVAEALPPSGVAARPLDLCQNRRPSLWLQTFPDRYRLTVINWHDHAAEQQVALERVVPSVPVLVVNEQTNEEHHVADGKVMLALTAHDSAVLVWPR